LKKTGRFRWVSLAQKGREGYRESQASCLEAF
jgi:hypothetical protein